MPQFYKRTALTLKIKPAKKLRDSTILYAALDAGLSLDTIKEAPFMIGCLQSLCNNEEIGAKKLTVDERNRGMIFFFLHLPIILCINFV
jgi:hypothetical protein